MFKSSYCRGIPRTHHIVIVIVVIDDILKVRERWQGATERHSRHCSCQSWYINPTHILAHACSLWCYRPAQLLLLVFAGPRCFSSPSPPCLASFSLLACSLARSRRLGHVVDALSCASLASACACSLSVLFPLSFCLLNFAGGSSGPSLLPPSASSLCLRLCLLSSLLPPSISRLVCASMPATISHTPPPTMPHAIRVLSCHLHTPLDIRYEDGSHHVTCTHCRPLRWRSLYSSGCCGGWFGGCSIVPHWLMCC